MALADESGVVGVVPDVSNVNTGEFMGIFIRDELLSDCGVSGISTTGLGECTVFGTYSEWPVDRKMPFRTGHGA